MKSLPLLSLLAILMQGCSPIHTITPVEMTRTSLGETLTRIDIYQAKEGKMPETLDLLAVRPGYGNRITDGWGRKLIYTLAEDGSLTLSSLGADGKVGGTGDDADLSISQKAKESSPAPGEAR